MNEVVLVGAGGHGRDVLSILDAMNRASNDSVSMLGWLVEPQYSPQGSMINGKPVLGWLEWFSGKAGEVKAICAVGDPKARMRLVKEIAAMGIGFFNAIHPSVLMPVWTVLGEGVVINAGVTLADRVTVKDHSIVNLNATVGHNSVVSEFAMVAPGANISGNCHIGKGAYIGTGSAIIEKITIGEWAMIGAGAAVVRDIPANVTAVGVPARVISKRDDVPA